MLKYALTDCFDTLLLRKANVDSVKRRWAKDLSFYLRYNITNQEIYDIRIRSEIASNDYYNYQDLCSSMYNKIQSLYQKKKIVLEYSQETLTKKMYELELQNEVKSLSVDYTHLDNLSSTSEKIVIVSDMYCGENFIWDLLRAFKIDDRIFKVFVSCDYKLSKTSLKHSLYSEVLAQLKIDAKDTIMYDDMQRCIDCAQYFGIQTKKVKTACKRNDESLKSVCRELSKLLVKKYSSLASIQNYSLSFCLFIERLYKDCVNKKIKKLYFLSREGQFIKKLFDKYLSIYNYKIETKYLYVSRKAVLSASFLLDPFTPSKSVEKHFAKTTIRNILNKIGFEDAKIKSIESNTQIDLDDEVLNYWSTPEWKSLCDMTGFVEEYQNKVKQKSQTFSAYLKQEGFFDDENIALVDIGWKGTMQDGIKHFISDDFNVYGFYFGLTEFTNSEKNNNKFGLVFSASDNVSMDYDSWEFYHTQMESIMAASHAGTKGYEYDSTDKIVPEFQEWGSEKLLYEFVSDLQDRILKIFENIVLLIKESSFDIEDFYKRILINHIKTTMCIGVKKSRFFRKLQFMQIDNFVCNCSNSEEMKNNYGIFKNFNKIFENLSTLKNPVRMIRILQTNNLDFLIPFFIRKARKKFLSSAKVRRVRSDQ